MFAERPTEQSSAPERFSTASVALVDDLAVDLGFESDDPPITPKTQATPKRETARCLITPSRYLRELLSSPWPPLPKKEDSQSGNHRERKSYELTKYKFTDFTRQTTSANPVENATCFVDRFEPVTQGASRAVPICST